MSKTNYFYPYEFQLEGAGFRKRMKQIFEGTEKMSNIFVEPGLEIASPLDSAGVEAKTKNPLLAEKTSKIPKSLTGGKIFITNRYAPPRTEIESFVIYFI